MSRAVEALEAARHALTTLHGLVAHDGAAPAQTWTIDESATLALIDEALAEGDRASGVDGPSAEAWATARPWNDLRVGRSGRPGVALSYEAQLCNHLGEAVFIVTHDGSAEALANVALVMRAVNGRAKLLADVAEARALAMRLGETCERQGRLIAGAVTFEDAIGLFVKAIVAEGVDAPNCAEWRGVMAGRGFVLSLQWADGKSPQELLSAAMGERDAERARADAAETRLRELTRAVETERDTRAKALAAETAVHDARADLFTVAEGYAPEAACRFAEARQRNTAACIAAEGARTRLELILSGAHEPVAGPAAEAVARLRDIAAAAPEYDGPDGGSTSVGHRDLVAVLDALSDQLARARWAEERLLRANGEVARALDSEREAVRLVLAVRSALQMPDEATALDVVHHAGRVADVLNVVDRIAVALEMGYPAEPGDVVEFAGEVMAELAAERERCKRLEHACECVTCRGTILPPMQCGGCIEREAPVPNMPARPATTKLREERDALAAMLAGRPVAPTEAELDAQHAARGGWLFAWYGAAGTATEVVFDRRTAAEALEEAASLDGLFLALPLGSNRRPCTWPQVSP